MKQRKEIILALSFFAALFISNSLYSQDTIKSPFKFGFEYDLMAPRIGAWHSVNLSAYIGKGRLQHSLIFIHININEKHLTEESFRKDNINAFGYRFEIYSHKEMKRWSAGLLMIYSMNDVMTSINSQEGHYNTLIFGVPLGYTWLLWKHYTIKPSITILYPLTNRTVKIGIDEVNQAPWGLEPGIRLGYRF